MVEQMHGFVSLALYGIAGLMGGVSRCLGRKTPFTLRSFLQDMLNSYLLAGGVAGIASWVVPEHHECMALWGVAFFGGYLGHQGVEKGIRYILRKKLGGGR